MPRIPRDLETIVLKALEKEPGRRYASAADLARDLHAFADGRTIQARRVSAVGRSWRAVKRNRARSTLVVALLLAAAVATVALLNNAREHSTRRNLEYELLLERSQDLTMRLDARYGAALGRLSPIETRAAHLLTDAISLCPERFEAYVERALTPLRNTKQRRLDIEAARQRGADRDVLQLAAALAALSDGDEEAALLEAARIPPAPASRPEAVLLEARLLQELAQPDAACARLDYVVDAPNASSASRYAAYRMRGRLLERRGDLDGALADLHSARALSGEPLAYDVEIASLLRRLGRDDQAQATFAKCMKAAAAKKSDSAWIQVSSACHRHREWAWLREVSEAAVHDLPGSAQHHGNLGVALFELGRTDDALAAWDRAASLDPHMTAVRENRGQALVQLGRHQEGLVEFDALIAEDEEDASVHANRAAALFALHRHHDALAACDRAIAIEPRLAEAHASRACALARLGDPEGALASADQAVHIAPDLASAHATRAGALCSLGRNGHSLDAATHALSLDPRCLEAHVNRGIALWLLDRPEEALVAFEEASRIDDRAPQVWENRSGVLSVLSRYREAVEAAEHAIRLDARSVTGFINLANALNNLGRFYDALAASEHARDLDPRLVSAHVNLGEALLGLRRPEQALKSFDDAVRISEAHVTAHTGRARALLRLARPREALSALNRALDLNPSDPEALNNAAWLQATSQDPAIRDPAKAVERARRAVQLLPSNGGFWNTLGAALCAAKNWPEALKAIETSMARRSGGNAHDWYMLALALCHAGREVQAREWLDKANRWAEMNATQDPELARFRAEAEAALAAGTTASDEGR